MAISQDVRDRVRRLYVFDQMSLEMAALTCEVSFSTARRWKTTDKQKGDDWDKVRAANMMAGGGMEEVSRSILSGFLLQYQTTIEEINSNGDIKATDKVQLLTSLADAFNKTVGASRKVLPETSQLATALEVLKLLGEFVQTKHPKHMAAFMDILEPFGAEIEKRFN